MPNTFNADGRPDVMSNQDQLAYLNATGGTIDGRPTTGAAVSATSPSVGVVDKNAAAQYQQRIAQEDAERRANASVKKKQTSFGLPMGSK